MPSMSLVMSLSPDPSTPPLRRCIIEIMQRNGRVGASGRCSVAYATQREKGKGKDVEVRA
jgi:hypothetical protein